MSIKINFSLRQLALQRLLLLLPGVLAFALDRASKSWVMEKTLAIWQSADATLAFSPQLLDLTLGEVGIAFSLSLNRGIAFGFLERLGSNSQISIIILSLLVVALFVKLALDKRPLLAALGASLIVGGALGNLYDRIYYEGVLDFIDAYAYAYHWYKFNLADVAITCGALFWLITELCNPRTRATTKSGMQN